MLMGLSAPLADGGRIGLTLVFAVAGAIPVTVPVSVGAPGGGTRVDFTLRRKRHAILRRARGPSADVNACRLWL